jgi:hypothetical protein
LVFPAAMKNFIKKIINFNLNSRPHSFIFTRLQKIDSDISDLFTYILGDYETIFIAENNLALLVGMPVDCSHIFHFFDNNGIFIRTYETNSQQFHFKLMINEKITGGSKFGSFTHHVKYSNIFINKYEKLLTNTSFQHRGYTGYRKDLNNGFSYVHGNFGGMYISKNNTIKSLARNRGKHTYTPQLIIKPSHRYEFIFVNPTSKDSNIKFFLIEQNDVKALKEICLTSHASFKFTLDDFEVRHESNISWETNLPIARCITFEHIDKFFDVFHS